MAHRCGRPRQGRAQIGDELLELSAGKAFVGKDELTELAGRSTVGQQGLGDVAFAELGLARHQLIGMPSGAHNTYSLRPQHQREWLTP